MQEQQRLRSSATRAANSLHLNNTAIAPAQSQATVLTLTQAQLDDREEDMAHNDVDRLFVFWVRHLSVELRSSNACKQSATTGQHHSVAGCRRGMLPARTAGPHCANQDELDPTQQAAAPE